MVARRVLLVVLMALLSLAFELRAAPAQEPYTQDCSLQVVCIYLASGTAVWDTGEIDHPFRMVTYDIYAAVVVSTLAGSPGDVVVVGTYHESFQSSSCLTNIGVGTVSVIGAVSADGTLRLVISKDSDIVPITAICKGTGGTDIPFKFPSYLPEYFLSGLTLADGATARGAIGSAAQAAGQRGTITLTLHDPRTVLEELGFLSVESSETPSVIGTDITFTVALTAVGGGGGGSGGCLVPTGMVTFLDGTRVLGTGTLSAAGVATLTTGSLSAGTHTITAIYGGDAKCPVRILGPLTQEVQGP